MNDVNTCCTHWCDFCDALTKTGDIGKTKEFEHNLGNLLASRTIFESENFVVIASLGQLTEGYLLLLSKEHYPSMAHLPTELYEELNTVHSHVLSILSQEYYRPIIFEHGPMPLKGDMNFPVRGGGSCVDHAHLHYVPIHFYLDLVSFIEKHFTMQTILNFEELKIQAERNMPYFFIENQKGKRYIFDVSITPSSQYLRQLIAVKIGEPEKWNWRIYPEIERLINTVLRLNNID